MAPRDLPPELMDGYIMGGRIRLVQIYYNNLYIRTDKVNISMDRQRC
jgi:hypothetical protein